MFTKSWVSSFVNWCDRETGRYKTFFKGASMAYSYSGMNVYSNNVYLEPAEIIRRLVAKNDRIVELDSVIEDFKKRFLATEDYITEQKKQIIIRDNKISCLNQDKESLLSKINDLESTVTSCEKYGL